MESREERFRRLYEMGRARVVAYAMRRTIDEEDAADVVAETFAIAWRRIDDIPHGEREVPWLYAVARRLIANRVRRNSTQSAILQRLAQQLATSGAAVDEPDSERLSALTALQSAIGRGSGDLDARGVGWSHLPRDRLGDLLHSDRSPDPTSPRSLSSERCLGRWQRRQSKCVTAIPGGTRAMRNSLAVLRAADPARHVDFQGLKANPVFDELVEEIVAGDFVAEDEHLETGSRLTGDSDGGIRHQPIQAATSHGTD